MEISKPKHVNNKLGIDQLWEVFSWLPAKEAIKTFSSVSKTAHSILSEPLFAEKQSLRSSRFDSGFFLQPDRSWNSREWLEVHNLSLNGPNFPDKSFAFLQNRRIMSSSQGLVLLRETGRDIGLIICNPVTRMCAPVHVPEWLKQHKIRNCGILLACHPSKLVTGTVVVPVMVAVDDGGWGVCDKLAIYRDGKWEAEMFDLTIKGREFDLEEPVAVFRGSEDGLVVHYVCKSSPNALRRPIYEEPYLVGYSVQRKALTRIFKLPEGAWEEEDYGQEKLKIFKWGSDGETIGVVRVDGCMITVWVMEDYECGVWRKVMKKSTIEMGVLEEAEEEADVISCSVVNSRVLVFATNWRVYKYEMDGPNVGNLEVVAEHDYSSNTRVVFTAYANTLRPVDIDGVTSFDTFDDLLFNHKFFWSVFV